MKNCFLPVVSVGLIILPLQAQVASARVQKLDATRDLEAGKYAVVERGANHQVWQHLTRITNAITKKVHTRTNQVIELGSGMFYEDQGTWKPTREVIRPVAGGALVDEGPHKVKFPLDIYSKGGIEYTAANGEKMASHVLGLAMMDATGKQVMFGQVKSTKGQVTAANQVMYVDAFDGVKADVRYTYRKHNFEQDVILREAVDPADYGLDSRTTVFQVFTEFVEYPDKETVKGSGKTNAFEVAAQKTGFDRGDRLALGSARFGRGYAFADGEEKPDKRLPVVGMPMVKRLERREGRDFLVESVTYLRLKPLLEKLPRKVAAKRFPARDGEVAFVLPPQPKMAERLAAGSMAVAALTQAPGVVLDYQICSSYEANFVFEAGTTYLITSTMELSGATKIEGGAVLKYTDAGYLYNYDTVECLTTPYCPAIFTSQYDHQVGEIIRDSNTGEPIVGDPSASYWYALISLGVTSLENVRFSYAYYPVMCGGLLTCQNVQFTHCSVGISQYSYPLSLFNVLFYDLYTAVESDTAWTGAQITAHGVTYLDSYATGTIKNSLLANVTYPGTQPARADLAIVEDAAGVFQTARLGSHYLPASSPYRNQGMILPAEQAKLLSEQTTWAPAVLNQTLTANMVLVLITS